MGTPVPANQDTRIGELGEPSKELDFLYAISRIAADPNATLDSILQRITDKIPSAFRNPESTWACIAIGSKEIRTASFKTCRWNLETDIFIKERIAGKIRIGYLGTMALERNPFLEEEKKLLGEIAARIGTILDVKTLQEDLEHSEKRYRNLVENALVGIFQTNLRGDLLYANSTSLRMFGCESLEEAASGGILSRYRNPEHRKTIVEILQQTGRLADFELECLTKGGESLFVLFSAKLESDVVTGMMTDITERKRANEALIKSEMRLAEAQRIAHLGSWDWDIGAGELHWSDEVYRIFGLRPREFDGTYEAFFNFIHPDDRQAVREAVQESLSRPGKAYSIEHRVVRRDGQECVVHERGEITFDKEFRPIRMIGTVHDITPRQHSEMELQKAFEKIKMLKEKLETENILLRDEIELKGGYGEVVGTSDPMKYAIHRIRQVAPRKATVLLTGETGTGKGVFARFLHRESDRRDKVFVHVNCAGLPPNLIEKELFGSEKGAFTGSVARQIGRFELANGGTIFLDEIGELPLELQAKLLKVIEDEEFERLGSPHPVKVDVRIIASTNRILEEEIKNGRFRRDLFYRLNVFPVTIPSLRQRREDIPLLVKYFVNRISRGHGKRILRISEKTMKALQDYDWPGNVRELMNVLERAVITSDDSDLRLAERIDASKSDALKEPLSKEVNSQQPRGLVEMEKAHILRILQGAGWRIDGSKGAALLLGMNPSTLRTRMKKLGIRRPGD